MQAIEAFLEILARAGVRYVFGNPGTTELPLVEAMARQTRLQYILGLQEIPVMAMADGLAMASGRPSVVNLHSACGLGNGLGMLYNAWCEGTPILVTAGQQDRRLRLGEPVLEADLVSVARPWTKWAVEVQRADDVPTALRRAYQVAMTPPTGPVFLSLPVDVQSEECTAPDLSAPSVPGVRIRPDRAMLVRAAQLLARAQQPVILAGSRVAEGAAGGQLAALADLLQAPVIPECTTSHGRLPMPPDHPLYDQNLPLWSPDVRERLAPYDLILAVGLNVLRLYIHQPPDYPLPDGVPVIHLDVAPGEIAKNYPVQLGLWGDISCGLEELAELLRHEWAGSPPPAVVERGRKHRDRIALARRTLRSSLDQQRQRQPMTSWSLMGVLADVLPPEVAVVEEAITSHHGILEQLAIVRDPVAYFAHRGWALGWGLGCALGVKLAWPERPVVGLLGDGAALYGIQGLWTAARDKIGVTFIVCNNRRYKILQVCGEVMQLPCVTEASAPGVRLDSPEVDFVRLAESFGVTAWSVDSAEELADRVRDSLRGNEPVLIDVRIDD